MNEQCRSPEWCASQPLRTWEEANFLSMRRDARQEAETLIFLASIQIVVRSALPVYIVSSLYGESR